MLKYMDFKLPRGQWSVTNGLPQNITVIPIVQQTWTLSSARNFCRKRFVYKVKKKRHFISQWSATLCLRRVWEHARAQIGLSGVGTVLYSSCHLLIEDIRITFVTSKADKNRSGILEKKYQLNLICKQKASAFSSLLKRWVSRILSLARIVYFSCKALAIISSVP